MIRPRLYFDLPILGANDTVASLDFKSQSTLQNLDVFALIGVEVCWRPLRAQGDDLGVTILDGHLECERTVRAGNYAHCDGAIKSGLA